MLLSGSPEELILEDKGMSRTRSLPASLHTWDEDGIPLQATEPQTRQELGAVRDTDAGVLESLRAET